MSGSRSAGWFGGLIFAAIAVGISCGWRGDSSKLPEKLSDEAFWRLSTELSEPAGEFRHSDNLVSNEALYVHTIRLLRPSGGVYIGVGPEQNFSYIARLEPAMAFIIDIRQENRNLHLLYKVLFELSSDRAEFVSRLFSRERPAGLDGSSSVNEIFSAIGSAPVSTALREQTARAVRERLLDSHHWPLTESDLEQIDYAFGAFAADGPGIHYARALPKNAPGPSYHALMDAADFKGVRHSYLASEDAFAFVKDMHARNLIVPVVGDFGGPGAINRVADYIRRHGGVVSTFYSSNVEVYLSLQQMNAYCQALATLPAERDTVFLDSRNLQPLSTKLAKCSPAVTPAPR